MTTKEDRDQRVMELEGEIRHNEGLIAIIKSEPYTQPLLEGLEQIKQIGDNYNMGLIQT